MAGIDRRLSLLFPDGVDSERTRGLSAHGGDEGSCSSRLLASVLRRGVGGEGGGGGGGGGGADGGGDAKEAPPREQPNSASARSLPAKKANVLREEREPARLLYCCTRTTLTLTLTLTLLHSNNAELNMTLLFE